MTALKTVADLFDWTTPDVTGPASDYCKENGQDDLADLLTRAACPPLVSGEDQEGREAWEARVAHRATQYATGQRWLAERYWPERHQTEHARIIVYLLPALPAEEGHAARPERWQAEIYFRSGGSLKNTIGPPAETAQAAVVALGVFCLGRSGGPEAQAAYCRCEIVRVPIRMAFEDRPDWWER